MISHRISILGLSKLQLLVHCSLRGAMRKSSPQGTQSSRHLGVPSRGGVGLQMGLRWQRVCGDFRQGFYGIHMSSILFGDSMVPNVE